MTAIKALRPYQREALEFYRRQPSRRAIFDHCPGAGKTLVSFAIREALKAPSMLVICPARARTVWLREGALWAPGVDIHNVCYGRTRKLPKVKAAIRDLSYSKLAANQVISFALLDEIEAQVLAKPPALIVIDESHHLSDPQSSQSVLVKRLLRKLPKVPCIFLTGTFIRKEIAGIWNQLDTLWPAKFGKGTQAGDVSWDFRERYCGREESEHTPSGFVHSGTNLENLPELKARIAPYVHTVTEDAILEYLPKLDVQPLYIDDNAKPKEVVQQWVAQARNDFPHIAVICYHKDLAHELSSNIRRKYKKSHVYTLTGLNSPEQRANALDHAATLDASVLVATSEAVGESMDLTLYRKALILEWRQTPGQSQQLMRRFWRAKPGALPVYLQYAMWPDDEAQAEKLLERMAAVKGLQGNSAAAGALDVAMKPRELTAERLDTLFEDMFSEVRTIGEEEHE